MEIVSLSKAAELTGKSKSTISNDLKKGTLKGIQNERNEWEINTNDLFAIYPEKEYQKSERLEAEIVQYKAKILELENRLKEEIAERERLEGLIDEANKNVPIEIPPIPIIYNHFPVGWIEQRQDEIQHIKNLLSFIQLNGLTNNLKILKIFRRFLGSYTTQRDNYNNTYFKPKEFSYYIYDEPFYKYMMLGWYNIHNFIEISNLRLHFDERFGFFQP